MSEGKVEHGEKDRAHLGEDVYRAIEHGSRNGKIQYPEQSRNIDKLDQKKHEQADDQYHGACGLHLLFLSESQITRDRDNNVASDTERPAESCRIYREQQDDLVERQDRERKRGQQLDNKLQFFIGEYRTFHGYSFFHMSFDDTYIRS